MKIIDLLKPNSIALNYAPESKEQLYDKLISLHDGAGTISDKKQFKADRPRRVGRRKVEPDIYDSRARVGSRYASGGIVETYGNAHERGLQSQPFGR